MRHEEATDPTCATMDDAPPDGLMALVHATQERGFGIGILPDEADMAGLCAYSSERITRIVAAWCQHNHRIANYVQGLPTRADYDALLAEHAAVRERLAALDTQVALLTAQLGRKAAA